MLKRPPGRIAARCAVKGGRYGEPYAGSTALRTQSKTPSPLTALS